MWPLLPVRRMHTINKWNAHARTRLKRAMTPNIKLLFLNIMNTDRISRARVTETSNDITSYFLSAYKLFQYILLPIKSAKNYLHFFYFMHSWTSLSILVESLSIKSYHSPRSLRSSRTRLFVITFVPPFGLSSSFTISC